LQRGLADDFVNVLQLGGLVAAVEHDTGFFRIGQAGIDAGDFVLEFGWEFEPEGMPYRMDILIPPSPPPHA
jgi:hypothetical protein